MQDTASLPAQSAPRKCLGCNYDLQGLGDEPQCPECGLQNIPDGYRHQVWSLVDARTIFFSGPFQLFRKRPPGWWWALDRDGDLRRSFNFAARSVFVAWLLLTVGCVALSCAHIENTWRLRTPDPERPGQWTTVHETIQSYFLHGFVTSHQTGDLTNPQYRQTKYEQSRRFAFHGPRFETLWVTPAFGLFVLLSWAVPAYVGIVSQLRKGLPGFARPPRTVIAAANLESHRTIYVALILLCFLPLVVIAAAWFMQFIWILVFASIVVLFAACGFIGPVRSDYTHTLIRSRFHAARIVVMYGLFFTLLITLAVIQAVGFASTR